MKEMPQSRNILFIMCDLLGTDYLVCYDRPYLKTQYFYMLASHGACSKKAYCQAPLCDAPPRPQIKLEEEPWKTS